MTTTVTNNIATAQSRKQIPTVSIYGLPFSKMSMDETIAKLTEAIANRETMHVITANPIMVMSAIEDQAYYNMMRTAELIVPDGTGVVWAANYVGEPVAERVPGFDILHRLMALGESKGWSVYLLGTDQQTIDQAAANLKQKYPGTRIAGVRNGYFGPDQDAEVVAEIRAAQPDILFVARSASTQEPWIARYKGELGVPVIMGVGGSFDIIAGKLKRAPKLFQKLRLEWFYRLLQEPYRYKRMLVLPKFVIKVIREKEKVTKARP
ncbi:acetylglucosaminyldiphosphoundecaprenol acetyl-beta-D-mannosaminyltransferase [Paenibacillus sp. CCS19]|uniref:WecB/TagA/CpsF family glycosyltransferase n=1 Tax=Paenibacillus sp. CCS19 TaxID=3158387 RepID=UPI00255FD383|nr:WecB/TagA/CpsF family glycosyltransferase [Paenibacillus cellulosilyticus]GMK38242.1 acetylglucosaminyldiphosphoundecaprenol acetyl-beta-D-mannosaminyltransferase [Paenibacillus cellulosilyticus]